MENDVHSSEILCSKISENPLKGFLQLLDRMKKKIYIFSNTKSLKPSFALGHGIVHVFLGHPNVQCIRLIYLP